LNPSKVEFVDDQGRLLVGPKRRLATAESLGVRAPGLLNDAQADRLLEECAQYFFRNPYRRWFDQLDAVIDKACGAGYYDGSACHLDLSVWATEPAWGGLGGHDQQRLLADGVPILRSQLEAFGFDIVLLNGKGVIDQVSAAGLADLNPHGSLAARNVVSDIYAGTSHGAQWVGWSKNLQSSFGITNYFREQLAVRVKQLTSADLFPRSPMPDRKLASRSSAERFVTKQTLYSKREFFRVLERWLQESTAPTIADIDTYGGRAWLQVQIGSQTVHLNADTKRKAVQTYVQRCRGNPDGPWPVVANRNGRVNKVLQGPDSKVVDGWYAYLKTPLERVGHI
jgi:hypothetical protein